MTTPPAAGTDAWLRTRSRELRRWVDEAFEDAEDAYDITDGINRLVYNKQPADQSHDAFFRRILCHRDISPQHVYTLLTMLIRHGDGNWRKPLPPSTLSADEELFAGVARAGLDAAVVVYRSVYEADTPVQHPTFATQLSPLVDGIRRMGGDMVTTAASLVRRVRRPDGEVPLELVEVREAIIGDFISRGGADEALEFYEATTNFPTGADITKAFRWEGGMGTETLFMAGFCFGVRFAEELRRDIGEADAEEIVDAARTFEADMEDQDMEELADAARAFEEDPRWQKRPLDGIRFVPGVGGTGLGSGLGADALEDEDVQNWRESERVLEKMGWEKRPLRFVSLAEAGSSSGVIGDDGTRADGEASTSHMTQADNNCAVGATQTAEVMTGDAPELVDDGAGAGAGAPPEVIVIADNPMEQEADQADGQPGSRNSDEPLAEDVQGDGAVFTGVPVPLKEAKEIVGSNSQNGELAPADKTSCDYLRKLIPRLPDALDFSKLKSTLDWILTTPWNDKGEWNFNGNSPLLTALGKVLQRMTIEQQEKYVGNAKAYMECLDSIAEAWDVFKECRTGTC